MKPSKVAFITGCSNGLGFATAVKMIKAGYIVYATMRSLEKKQLLQEACKNSDSLHVIKLELTDESAIHDAVDLVVSRHQRIDVLIHNAAASLLGPADTATSAEVEYLFKINVFSVHKLTQLFLPQMRKQKAGHLIFISSISGIESSAYLGIYAATKFALEALASSWATTLPEWGIKTTIIEPGAMDTNLPSSIALGSYYNSLPENPYSVFNTNALDFLKKCLKMGAEPMKVADLIIEIINTSNPHLRYQTCTFSTELVGKHLHDPKGDRWVEEHRQFIDSFYRKL